MTLYTDLLANWEAPRVIAVELEVYTISGQTSSTLYLSSDKLKTQSGDTPAFQSFSDVLIGLPVIRRSLWDGKKLATRSKANYGSFRINNANGWFDTYLNNGVYNIVGRSVVIKMGQDGWDYSEFGTVSTGIVSKISIEGRNHVVLHLGTKKTELRILPPASREVYDGENSLSTDLKGDTNVEGKNKPKALGKVFNISPPMINEAGLIYQVDDGPINAFPAVRDKGATLTLTTDYTVNTTNGTFALTGSPEGTVTADVQGNTLGGTYSDNLAAITKYMLTTSSLGQLPSSLVDTSSFTTVSALSLGSHGIFLSADQMLNKTFESLRDAIDDLVSGSHCYLFENREGKLALGQFDEPKSTADFTLTATTGIIDVNEEEPPPIYHRIGVGYKRNYTIQSQGELAGVVAGTTAGNSYGEPFTIAYAEDSSIKDDYPLAEEYVHESYMYDESDAQDEADRLLVLFGEPRRILRVDCTTVALNVELGETVAITWDRHNLSNFKAVVVEMTEDLEKGIVTLMVWG